MPVYIYRERTETERVEREEKLPSMATAAYVASGASSMATSGFVSRLSTTSYNTHRPALPYLRPRSAAPSFSASFNHFSDYNKLTLFQIKSSSSDETSEVGEVFSDLKEKWDALENKSIVVLYGSGAIVAIWLSFVIVGAIDSIPLLPNIMKLVGLGYTGWFVYRYLLFKSSRTELASEIETLKKKIAGSE